MVKQRRWMVLPCRRDGLLNDGVYGLDAEGATVRPTLLRSPVVAHHHPSEPAPAQRHRYQNLGIQEFVFRLVPHAGAWQDVNLPSLAWEPNCPPYCVNDYAHAGPLPAAWLGPCAALQHNIRLSVVKGAEDGRGLMVRGYETEGRATGARITLPSARIERCVASGPHDIRTWRVELQRGRVEELDLLERAA